MAYSFLAALSHSLSLPLLFSHTPTHTHCVLCYSLPSLCLILPRFPSRQHHCYSPRAAQSPATPAHLVRCHPRLVVNTNLISLLGIERARCLSFPDNLPSDPGPTTTLTVLNIDPPISRPHRSTTLPRATYGAPYKLDSTTSCLFQHTPSRSRPGSRQRLTTLR